MLTFALVAALPVVAFGQIVAHNTPSYVATAKNLGAEDPSKVIEVSLWLNPHDADEMDSVARDLYDPKSPNFRHWLRWSQIAARFAPSAEEAKTVRDYVEAHNLQVILMGSDNFFVRARGTVADVQRAFHVQLNNYQVRNKIVRANASDPHVEGAAGALVRAVSGLDSGEYVHPLMEKPRAVSGFSRNSPLIQPAVAGLSEASVYSSNCFDGVVTRQVSTNGDGELPIGTYKGNHLNKQTLTSAGCGYTPAPIQKAYHLTELYAKGYTGKGQTIVIIDWCGSSTIQSDANVFSKTFGLPLLNSSNFKIIYTPVKSPCISEDQVEINLDVEWAHAIAPGAHIDLVVPPSATFQDVEQAMFYAINKGLGNSISGSYGSPEVATPASTLDVENLLAEMAAMSGISANFASGDQGDYSTSGTVSVIAPADSPWATAVGGVTLALNSDDSIAWQTGWGNNETLLSDPGFVFDPPFLGGFSGGSGGGVSTCAVQDNGNCSAGFAKPAFQNRLPGKYRLLPDIAWLADPFTGVAVAISVADQEPQLIWQVWGGTSLATPMFSALWAIANQEAGVALGQAAQYVYSMPRETITDVVPVSLKTNVTATIVDSAGKTTYAPSEVLSGMPPGLPNKFISAIFDNVTYGQEVAVSFGTDCTATSSANTPFQNPGTPCNSATALHTTVGWDDVTGVGTPNAEEFAEFFKPGAGPDQ